MFKPESNLHFYQDQPLRFESGIEIRSFNAEEGRSLYPSLWDVPDSPMNLWVQGAPGAFDLLKRLPEDGLAVVGTRHPQQRSLSLVRQWIHDLQGSKLVVLSGFATGIDSAAHWAALEAGLPTIAIIGTGLDKDYPRGNFKLRRQILKQGGLVISEYPLGSPGKGYHFLQRNRLIAGWSKATWVIEAGYQSGALNTARWAREQDRTCFAVPGFPGDPTLLGNQTLLDRDHALPTWGIHSLGAVWMDLATHTRKSDRAGEGAGVVETQPLSDEENLLLRRVEAVTFERGGAFISELLDWAISQGWSASHFFASLESLLQKKRLRDHHGIVVAN